LGDLEGRKASPARDICLGSKPKGPNVAFREYELGQTAEGGKRENGSFCVSRHKHIQLKWGTKSSDPNGVSGVWEGGNNCRGWEERIRKFVGTP